MQTPSIKSLMICTVEVHIFGMQFQKPQAQTLEPAFIADNAFLLTSLESSCKADTKDDIISE